MRRVRGVLGLLVMAAGLLLPVPAHAASAAGAAGVLKVSQKLTTPGAPAQVRYVVRTVSADHHTGTASAVAVTVGRPGLGLVICITDVKPATGLLATYQVAGTKKLVHVVRCAVPPCGVSGALPRLPIVASSPVGPSSLPAVRCTPRLR